MGKYRKLPVVIEARRVDALDYEEAQEIMAWCEGYIPREGYLSDALKVNELFVIDTLEGGMMVSHGDYVIKGIKGEFYPCKPDIFEASYEKVEE